MGLMSEYINQRLSVKDLEAELLKLIKKYNTQRKSYLIVYVAAINKQNPDVALRMDDYYVFYDLLKGKKIKNLDIYLETPGGSGEAVEEIIRCLRKEFKDIPISFVVSGEAKSAGTIMVLGGNEILMTRSGSLGPIDAQTKIGRSHISAYDYMQWVDEKRDEAEEKKKLNPFDAVMIAQISPGEIKGVNNALHFAKDLVVEWLSKYKFKSWDCTETRKIPVTEVMKVTQAKEIATKLLNHEKWRSHGRSIKIDDLEEIVVAATQSDRNSRMGEKINDRRLQRRWPKMRYQFSTLLSERI